MKQILIMLYILTQTLPATDYALIVGIGEYKNKNVPKLSELSTDIKNYKKILQHYNVSPRYTYELVDKKATKQNILSYLATIAQKVHKNDRFFMFFSGHGTSLFDENYSQKLQRAKLTTLMQESGAVLPYNFNPYRISQTLIIGKRDFKSYFEKIDNKGVNSLIVFDACFSENSIRNHAGSYINRTPNILTENSTYPYRNIVYIASSIVQSQSGKFSPILKKCLHNRNKISSLKQCINDEIGNSMQIPAILTYRNRSLLFP